jgi:predicted aspartyl protease/Tfp pilus assembly protein PilF
MKRSLTVALCLAAFVFLATLLVYGQPSESAPSSASPALSPTTEADLSFRSGQFVDAAHRYAEAVRLEPASVPARLGLIRSYLKAEMVKDAFDSATQALAINSESAALHSAMGEVLFRRGDLNASESEFQKSLVLDKQDAHALLGFARLYGAQSLYKKEFGFIQKAYAFAPDNSDVQEAWLGTLPRKKRIKALDEFLATPKPLDANRMGELKRYLTFLKALDSQPKHGCQLVTKLDRTNVPLQSLRHGPQDIRGWGLNVKINDQKTTLLLDTGASGLVISKRKAERAGVVRISDSQSEGIGDNGPVKGYTGYVKSIRIGELEFQDCIVDVLDRRSVAGDEGLIGADVFDSFLINIDFPGQQLKLSPLPARPGESVVATSALNTGGDQGGSLANSGDGESALPAPQDRFIAPEMKDWTRIYRFGHMLLIPTRVNDTAATLFLIDTGAEVNLFSTDAVRQSTKVSTDDFTIIKGLSGSVKKVYTARKAKIQFGYMVQGGRDLLAVDLSQLGKWAGTEVSGVLGIETMTLLEVKIDYRDGLVDFVYNPARTGTQNARTE